MTLINASLAFMDSECIAYYWKYVQITLFCCYSDSDAAIVTVML